MHQPPSAPHHDGSELHVPDQDPDLGDRIPVFLHVPTGHPADRVHLRAVVDGEPRYVEAVGDRRDASGTWWRAELDVLNPVVPYRWHLSHRRDHTVTWVNGLGEQQHDPTDTFDFRVTTHPRPPAWARGAVIYQIFPDRFARSTAAPTPDDYPDWALPAGWEEPVVHQGPDTPRQLYGGDLDGIVDRLDHLERLGVDVVYLTPFFPAESNHRYNASTFDRVDPLLGGEAALGRLVDAAHRRGMRVIGDLTTNHTGDTHEWFRAALDDPDAEEAAFYFFGEHPNGYASWFDVPTLPKLDHRSEALRRRLLDGPTSVAGRWLTGPSGLDGWRIDVANMTGRHRACDINGEVARVLRATLRATGDKLLIAEHCHDFTADLDGSGWHAAMNYAGFTKPVLSWLATTDRLPFLGMPGPIARFDGPQAVRTIREHLAAVPWVVAQHQVNLLDSHDTPRLRSIVGSDARADTAALLQYTLPGSPMLFMGDELGLEGENGEHARTPMPWHAPSRFETPTHRTYRDLAELRRRHSALRHGSLRWLPTGADAIAFVREDMQERLLVVASREVGAPTAIPAWLGAGAAEPLYGDGTVTSPGSDGAGGEVVGSGVWRLER